jgi:DNA primase
MEQITDLYGYRVKHGFMVCPFHGDRDASLRIYKGTNGWHCFGCGRGGSVIDFVMEQEGCAFPIAVRALDQTFHLGLMDPYENPQDAEIKHRIQRAFDQYAAAAEKYLDTMAMQIEIRQRIRMEKAKSAEEKRATDPGNLTMEEYIAITTWRDESEQDDYRMEQIDSLRKEVEAWRRKARRTG